MAKDDYILHKRTTAELYRQSVSVRLREAERTNAPDIMFLKSEVSVLNDLLTDYIRLLRKEATKQ